MGDHSAGGLNILELISDVDPDITEAIDMVRICPHSNLRLLLATVSRSLRFVGRLTGRAGSPGVC